MKPKLWLWPESKPDIGHWSTDDTSPVLIGEPQLTVTGRDLAAGQDGDFFGRRLVAARLADQFGPARPAGRQQRRPNRALAPSGYFAVISVHLPRA